MTGMISLVGNSSLFWFSILLTPPLSLSLDVVVSAFRIIWHPSDLDQQRLEENNYRPLLDGSSLMDCVRRNSKTNNEPSTPEAENVEMVPTSFAFSIDEAEPVRKSLQSTQNRGQAK